MSLFVREIEHFNLKDNQMGISLIIIHFIKFKIYLMIINYYPQTEKNMINELLLIYYSNN